MEEGVGIGVSVGIGVGLGVSVGANVAVAVCSRVAVGAVVSVADAVALAVGADVVVGSPPPQAATENITAKVEARSNTNFMPEYGGPHQLDRIGAILSESPAVFTRSANAPAGEYLLSLDRLHDTESPLNTSAGVR